VHSGVLVGRDPCAIAADWSLDPRLVQKLQAVASQMWEETRRTVLIISGARTEAEQNKLRAQGRPAARNETSTHLSCPATGVDITMGFGVVPMEKATLGRIAFMHGLRWGGNDILTPQNTDPSTGIPNDWNHFDLGRRIPG